MQLHQLFINIRTRRGVADVRIDFALRSDADGHRLKVFVMDVGGNDAAPPRHFAPDQLRLQLFALRNVLHLLGDDALPRQMHLRHVSRSVRIRSFFDSCFNPDISQCHKSPENLARTRGKYSPLATRQFESGLWHRGVGAATCARPRAPFPLLRRSPTTISKWSGRPLTLAESSPRNSSISNPTECEWRTGSGTKEKTSPQKITPTSPA